MTAIAPPVSGLRQRALTAIVLAPLGIASVLYLPSAGFAILLAVLFLAGLREWARLSGLASLPGQIAFVVANAGVMLALWLQGPQLLQKIGIIGAAFWCIAPIWLRFFEFASAPSPRNQTIKLIAGVLAIVPAWCAGAFLHGDGQRGALQVLFVIVLIWCADIFAYFSGRRFGGRKLAPRISPGKTWAGVHGGLAGAALYALVCGWLFGIRDYSLLAFVVLSVITVMFSVVGDLFESLLKRHSGMKDSGTLFPGHGGVLDRFDSLFAALPIFVAGKLLIGS